MVKRRSLQELYKEARLQVEIYDITCKLLLTSLDLGPHGLIQMSGFENLSRKMKSQSITNMCSFIPMIFL